MSKRSKGSKGRRLDAVTAYLTVLRHAMHLDHWRIIVNEMAGETQAGVERDAERIALITPLETRHVATLDLYPPFFAYTQPDDWRHALVHELTHLLFADLQFAHLCGQEAMDARDWGHLHRQFTVGLERAVDDVAVVLSTFLPLPLLGGRA